MGLRLDTKLSHLLLNEGALQLEALEDAVQQQVVHGGALDTLLLELNLVDEAVIESGLLRAWDSPAVDRAEREDPDALAVTRLPSRMAVAMGLCPFKLDDDGLHVLVAAPVDGELLAEVGGLCGFDLVPHVIPEVRLHEALHRAYGVSLEDRYEALLAKLDGGPEREVPVRETLFDDQTEIRPPDASAEKRPPSLLKSEHDGADISPAAAANWDIVEALAHLAAQDRREGIAQVAVSFALRFVPFASVFGIRAGHAVGWHRAGPCEGGQFHALQLKIPEGSVAAQVLESPSPLIGKPPINEGNTLFLTWLGRRRPRTSLLIPIVVARRTVGILYADGGVRARDIQALSDLVAFGARIGPAFEALLRARHRAHADLFPGRAKKPPPAAPRPSSRLVGSGALDGTSPFARNYTGPISSPPSDSGAAVVDDDGMRKVGAQSDDEDEIAALAASLRSTELAAVGEARNADRSVSVTVRTTEGGPKEADQALLSEEETFSEDEDTINSDFSGFALRNRMGNPVERRNDSDDDDIRSDEEAVSFSGDFNAQGGSAAATSSGETLSDDSLAQFDADVIDDLDSLRSVDGTPADEPLLPQDAPEELTASGRRRRAPLLFDDRTEELSLERKDAPLFSEEGEGLHDDSAPIAPAGKEELVFPEYPRESTSDEAWTGALADTVARGLQGGASPASTIDVDIDDLSDFGLPPVAPAEPLPEMPPEARSASAAVDLDALESDPRLAPAPFTMGIRDAQRASSLTAQAIPLFAELGDDDGLGLEDPAMLSAPGQPIASRSTAPDGIERSFLDAAPAAVSGLGDSIPDAAASGAHLQDAASSGGADDGFVEDSDSAIIRPTPSLPSLPEVAAHQDSSPPRLASGAFASLIESALPEDRDELIVGAPDSGEGPAASTSSQPAASPAPILDDAIELHTGDVAVSHSLVDDGPYLEDVIINDPPNAAPNDPSNAAPSAHSTPPLPAAAANADDPNATQEIGADHATDAELVEDLGSLQPGRVADAKTNLIRRGVAAREAITDRFPGRLLIDVFGEGAAAQSAAELGPLVDVTVQLGKEGVLCAAPHLQSEFPAHRYAAVFVLWTLGDERSLDLLPAVLQDPEPRIRGLACEALLTHVANPRFESVLLKVRPQLKSPQANVRALGASLLGRFKDVGSVPALIALVDDKKENVRTAACRALSEVSLQDFGPKAKAWRKWWDKARKVSRIDWLIEGLRSANRGLRRQAIFELRSLAGDDFGYRVDDTKRQREASAANFAVWWAEQRRG